MEATQLVKLCEDAIRQTERALSECETFLKEWMKAHGSIYLNGLERELSLNNLDYREKVDYIHLGADGEVLVAFFDEDFELRNLVKYNGNMVGYDIVTFLLVNEEEIKKNTPLLDTNGNDITKFKYCNVKGSTSRYVVTSIHKDSNSIKVRKNGSYNIMPELVPVSEVTIIQ